MAVKVNHTSGVIPAVKIPQPGLGVMIVSGSDGVAQLLLNVTTPVQGGDPIAGAINPGAEHKS